MKQLTEKQKQLLAKMIISMISFLLGLLSTNSEVIRQVTEFVNNLII